jgi:hypothetical protein
MVQALQAYQEATKAVDAAAKEVASQWEGEAKDAFVENETNAYNFYVGIHEVGMGAASAVQKMIEQYNDMQSQWKSAVSN